MMKSDEKYQVPAWMRPLLPLLCNTGGVNATMFDRYLPFSCPLRYFRY